MTKSEQTPIRRYTPEPFGILQWTDLIATSEEISYVKHWRDYHRHCETGYSRAMESMAE